MNSPADGIDPNPFVMTLREAVAEANALPNESHLITFAGPSKLLPQGIGPTITLDSQLTLSANIYIAGPGANNLAIQRNAAMGDFRLFEIAASSSSIIGGVKLRGGQAAAGQSGGAILSSGNLTVTGCIIRDSNASQGGGIATAAQVIGGSTQKSNLTIYDTVITNNTAVLFGGGICVIDCDLTASNGVEISSNTSGSGGGIYINQSAAGFVPQVNLTSVYIAQNTASFLGGGIYCFKGDVTLTGGTIAFNTTTSAAGPTQGGGIHLRGAGATLIAVNSPTLSTNTAQVGDGLYIGLGAWTSGTITYVDDSYYDANPI